MGERTASRHARIRELLRLADRVVVVAKWLYNTLRLNDVDPGKLVLVRHGLSDEYLCASGAPSRSVRDRLRIGYIGRMDPVKGLRLLVSALKGLPHAMPIELHIYGSARSNEERHYLSAVRAMAGDDGRIIFHGELTASNRLDAYRSFDILAVPSLWLEAGPLVVLEAFAAGLPVLGSNAGGIAELVTDGLSGRLVEVGSVPAWTRQLRELAEQSMAGQWTWNVPPVRSTRDVAREMLEIYRHLSGPSS
jgi:glycosyltransferase involved in cell wall biosynthesis